MIAQQLVIMSDDSTSIDPNGSSGMHHAVTLKTSGSRPKQLAELHGIVVARIIAPPEPLLTVADIFGKGKGQIVRAEGLSCEVLADQTNVDFVPARKGPGRLPARAEPETPTGVPATESFVVRVISSADETNDMLNVPVQMKGRVQQFIRINRRGGPRSFPSPKSP